MNQNQQEVASKFADVRTDLKLIAKENAELVFDYDTKSGNKAARSQVHKLRSLNGMIDRAHKQIKADVLEQSRMIDGAKKELKNLVAEMIAIHAKPLKAIEDREAERLSGIQSAIDQIKGIAVDITIDSTLESANLALGKLKLYEVNKDVFQEATPEAHRLIKEYTEQIESICKSIEEQAAKDAELAALRKEKEENDRKERDRRIAAEAVEEQRLALELESKKKVEEAEARALAAEAEADAAREKLKNAESTSPIRARADDGENPASFKLGLPESDDGQLSEIEVSELFVRISQPNDTVVLSHSEFRTFIEFFLRRTA